MSPPLEQMTPAPTVTGSGLEVTAPSTQVALFHSPALLPCSFRTEASSINPQFLAIIWYFEDKQLLRFNNMENEVAQGFSLEESEARQGNASLTIHNVTITDQGTYKCLVIYSPNREHKEIKLNVHATPEVKIQENALIKDDKNQVYCSVSGFYPKEVKITWLRNNIEVLAGSEMGRFQTDADGTYRVDSSITLTPAQIQDRPSIGCKVEHVSLQRPIQDAFTVKYVVECTRRYHSGVIAALALLLIAALIFISIAAYLIKKKKYFTRFQVSHILQHQTLANEEMVTLHCMALNCSEVVKATWTLIIDGKELITVSDCQIYKDEERGPLMHPDYRVKTEQTERKGLQNVTTMLSFNPETSQYRKMEIKCKFMCGGKSKERSLTCTFEHKKPEMKDSIKVFFVDSKNIVCSATLENFYPRNIKIQWSYGADQYRDVVTTKEEITHNTKNHTYNAVSECKILSQSLEKSSDSYRVRVMWTHSSMDHPDSKETTLAEISLRPVMEDLVIPSLLHGMEAKLQCEIRGFFPDKLKVDWLRRDAGNPELYVLSSSDKYKIPMIESTDQPDNTFTCTASIIVLMSALTDDGSEFTCRVTHPSLKTYLEKSGNLIIKGIPEIEIKYLENTLRATISNFRPKNIKVTWRRAKRKEMEDFAADTVDEHENDDGTFTSVTEVAVKELKHHREYEVVVEHECLKSPTSKKIIRKDGKFYVVENGQELELPKCEDDLAVKGEIVSREQTQLKETQNERKQENIQDKSEFQKKIRK